MKNTRKKKESKYRVKYYLSQLYNGWQLVKWLDIDPLTFDATIPDGVIGYEVQYGTDLSIFNSYAVYNGQVKSFKEAVEEFPNAKLCLKITEKMIQKGKTTKELQKLFPKTDLQQKFESFVEECEKNEIPQKSKQKMGIVVMGKSHLQYVETDDVVVSE